MKKPSLLIVDDDEDLLKTLSTILREKGYQTETAKTGKKAIAKAKEKVFDVALIDVRLPDITGIELLRTLRKNHPTLMNIIITGYPSGQDETEALNMGIKAYILKPIDPEMLDRTIKGCLAQTYMSTF